MKVLMFIKKQSSNRTGWFKNSVMFLCLLAFFIMPIANMLSVNPALAAKNPGYFESLSDGDKYKFFQYATAMSYCFSGKSHKDHGSSLTLKVHRNVDGSLSKGIVFNRGNILDSRVYIGTMSDAYGGSPIAGYGGGFVFCMDEDFQKEAFKTFQIEPNELLCQMGYKKKGHKNASVEECINLGKTNDFETEDLPAPPGDVNFINALTTLTGYPNNAEDKIPYIKYRKYLDWAMGCVDGNELSTSSGNTRTLSVVKDGKVSEVYRSKGSGDYMWSVGDKYKGDPQFKCDAITLKLKEAANKYANSLKDAAIKNACSTFTGKELEACKAGIEHKGDSEYCETQYKGRDEEISACKQGQSAEIETPSEGDGGEEEGKNSCGVDGIGWLVCPLMSFAGSLGDASYSAISYFLSIDKGIFKDQENGGLEQAWKFFRDIANAVFAVIFLWVIFSQISNVGVSNYGIKKILPRLIIGALLVNLSFYLCQLAVDLSNILGFSLKGVLEGAASKVGTQSAEVGTFNTLIVGGLTLAGAGLFIFLAVSIPTIMALLLALLVVLVILIVRQAAVILLIAISPLAFAAWLLPNTENLFKKWVSILRGLLIVFPVISLLYGAGKLAGAVLAAVGTNDPNNPKETMQVAALAASILPLGATPFVLKSSLNSLGSFAGKLGGLSNMANKRLGGAVMGKSRIGDIKKGWQKSSAKRQADRRSGNTWIGRGVDKLRNSNSRLARGAGIILNSRRALDNSWAGRVTGLSEGAAHSQAVSDELFENEVKGQSLALRGMTSSEIATIARTGKTSTDKKVSRSMYAAAIDYAMANGSFDDRVDVYSSLAGKDAAIKNRVIKAGFAKGDNNILGSGFGDAILEDKIENVDDLKNKAIDNAASGNLQAEHLVQNGAATKWLSKAIADSKNEKASAAFKKAGEVAVSNPNTAKNINQTISDALSAHGVVVENTPQNTSSSNSQQNSQGSGSQQSS